MSTAENRGRIPQEAPALRAEKICRIIARSPCCRSRLLSLARCLVLSLFSRFGQKPRGPPNVWRNPRRRFRKRKRLPSFFSRGECAPSNEATTASLLTFPSAATSRDPGFMTETCLAVKPISEGAETKMGVKCVTWVDGRVAATARGGEKGGGDARTCRLVVADDRHGRRRRRRLFSFFGRRKKSDRFRWMDGP